MFNENLYKTTAFLIGCDIPTIKAVAEVESAGRCFTPEKRLMCLFECHVFSELTGGKFDKSHPRLSYPVWDDYARSLYEDTYDKEYTQRFSKAFALDADAAMQSTSWGGFQLMGFHYKDLGFSNVGEMVDFLKAGVDNHLLLFAKFILSKPKLRAALQKQDWATFAYFYNGKAYKKNNYDIKLAAAYTKYAKN